MYDDVTGIPRQTIAWQRLVIFVQWGLIALLAVVIVVLGINLGYAATHPTTYAFGFDRVRDRDGKGHVSTETVTPVNVLPLDGRDATMRKAAASYWLPIFAESLFTVKDLDTDRIALQRFVRPFVAPGSRAATTIKDYLTNYNPLVRKDRMRVTVIADPLADPRADGSYHITWTAKTYDLSEHLVNTSRGGMIVGLRWDAPAPAYDRQSDGTVLVTGNPVGLYVTSLDPDQSLDPRAASGGVVTPPVDLSR